MHLVVAGGRTVTRASVQMHPGSMPCVRQASSATAKHNGKWPATARQASSAVVYACTALSMLLVLCLLAALGQQTNFLACQRSVTADST